LAGFIVSLKKHKKIVPNIFFSFPFCASCGSNLDPVYPVNPVEPKGLLGVSAVNTD
jgi:hypothetical protein